MFQKSPCNCYMSLFSCILIKIKVIDKVNKIKVTNNKYKYKVFALVLFSYKLGTTSHDCMHFYWFSFCCFRGSSFIIYFGEIIIVLKYLN